MEFSPPASHASPTAFMQTMTDSRTTSLSLVWSPKNGKFWVGRIFAFLVFMSGEQGKHESMRGNIPEDGNTKSDSNAKLQEGLGMPKGLSSRSTEH